MNGPLRILIADDEPPARLRLKALLADIAGDLPNQVVAEAASGQEALAELTAPEAVVDVVLLDIRMPGLSGLALARNLAALARPPAVVFTTACGEHALDAFDLGAADYLLKPIRAERLLAALEKARRLGRTPTEGRRQLPVSEKGRISLLPVADILFLRAEQKYVAARTLEREWLLDESLAQLEQEFPQHFLRIHRNCLVARAALAGCERDRVQERHDGEEAGEPGWRVLLRGIPESLPVSRRQWPGVKAALEER